MIPIGKTMVSDELIEETFVCDLARCRGACCVEGESGAPLEDGELAPLQDNYERIAPYMTKEGRRAVKEQGLYTVDSDGDIVTPLVGDRGACAYAVFENGIAACAIEKAHAEGRSIHQLMLRILDFPMFADPRPASAILDWCHFAGSRILVRIVSGLTS